ncbi:unnamed protein product [Mucor hiemalis]
MVESHTSASHHIDEHNTIHLRSQERGGGKKITTIQGLSQKSNSERLCNDLEHRFDCQGQVFKDDELGSTIELSGNQQSSEIADFLVQEGIASKEAIKIHN